MENQKDISERGHGMSKSRKAVSKQGSVWREKIIHPVLLEHSTQSKGVRAGQGLELYKTH